MIMLNIRKADTTEYDAVRSFYHSLIRAMRGAEYHPGWEIDVYPAPEYLKEVIGNGELYIGEATVEADSIGEAGHDGETDGIAEAEGIGDAADEADHIGEAERSIVSCMVLNHRYNESYRDFEWPVQAADDEIMVIHALGVHPACAGRGIARQMVRKAISIARERKQKVMRLDVLKGNLPAEKLYEGEGFRKLHTLPMYYEDTGWTDYELYELIL